MKNILKLSNTLLLLLSLNSFSQEDPKTYIWPKDAAVKQNLEQWQDMKFGVLIHWGLYSKLGIVESWALCPEDEDWCRRGKYENYYDFVQAYTGVRKELKPTGYDPSKWSKAMKEAGVQYMIFSTKHHDGFCMFDTKQTDYKITGPDCPFSKDPKANVAKYVLDAFRKDGMKVGTYFSKPDWHCEYYWWPNFPPVDRNVNYNITKYPDRWNKYKEFTFNQVKELMSDYGKVDILWLDGAWVRPKATVNDAVKPWCKSPYDQDVDIPKIAAMAREKQPGLLVVDRWVPGEYENYLTPEQKVPDKPLGVPWESCVTMGGAWGWVAKDNFKTARQLVHMLCNVIAKGGNLLLGVGPSAEGDFDPIVYDRLKEIGKWIKTNKKAIYGTKPIAPYQEDKFVFTAKGKTVNAIYLCDEKEIPKEVVLNSFMAKRGSKVVLLGTAGDLEWRKKGGAMRIDIPENVRKKPAEKLALVFQFETE